MSGMKIFGIYEKELYHDEESGNSRFIIRTLSNIHSSFTTRKRMIRNKITKQDQPWSSIMINAMSINLPAYDEGIPVAVSGSFAIDSKEFLAESVKMQSQEESYALEFYVSACGLEFEEASKVVAYYGSNISVLDGYDKLSVVAATGINPEKIEKMLVKIRTTQAEQESFLFLTKYNVPYNKVRKLVEMYGSETIKKLSKNPYLYGAKAGLDLRQMENIGDFFNLSPLHPDRINLAVELALDRMCNNGHVYQDKEPFYKMLGNIVKAGIYKDYKIPSSMMTPSTLKSVETTVINGKSVVCNKKLVAAERRIYANVLRLSEGASLYMDAQVYSKAEAFCKMKYGSQQRAAFPVLLKKRGICILTGGPGTGKTTVVKGLLKALEISYPNMKIALCAPTGRAAQRMSESCERPATTVHRLLDYRPYGFTATYKNAVNPIKADVIVVDECSMMNIELMDMLLEAVKSNTLVLLVGDIHQLESVGAGNILHDLLKADERLIPRVMLTDVFRQKGDSPIITNAIKINKGLTDLIWTPDFEMLQTNSGEETLDVVRDLIKKMYNPADPFETQILCPARTGDAGILNLNNALQELLNPEGKEIMFRKDVKYRVNDKILMLQNNYEKDYYNGDIGIIKEISGRNVILSIRRKNYMLDKADLGEMMLAYGMTIHKSQGSEFQNVIIVMPKSEPTMLVRNLFYTAVTRGKKRVIVINEGDAMQTAIKTNKSLSRKTMLSLFFDSSKENRSIQKPLS